jgi:hypothetical protein
VITEEKPRPLTDYEIRHLCWFMKLPKSPTAPPPPRIELDDRDLKVLKRAAYLTRPRKDNGDEDFHEGEEYWQEIRLATWRALEKHVGVATTRKERDEIVGGTANLKGKELKRKRDGWSKDGKRLVQIKPIEGEGIVPPRPVAAAATMNWLTMPVPITGATLNGTGNHLQGWSGMRKSRRSPTCASTPASPGSRPRPCTTKRFTTLPTPRRPRRSARRSPRPANTSAGD